jgi:hypothetical protein
MPGEARAQAPDPTVTFLFCVESGFFEAQTVLVVESLRRFGGRFAGAPALAVTPRFGPPLSRHTLRRFEELGVTYVRRWAGHPYDWYPYTNKALAALIADEQATTEQVIWLDSDVLVLAEPELLLLAQGEDFAICAYDKNIGSSGPGDRNEPYWHALSNSYGISIDDLPWIETQFDRQRVRFRLHSGVYSFRRGLGLGVAFVADMERMFTSRIAYTRQMPFPGDDVALAFSVVKRKLRWRLLPMAYNYEIGPDSQSYRREGLRSASILHYHHVLANPERCRWMLKELDAELPEVAQWLRSRVPLAERAGGVHHMLLRRALRELRHRRGRKYQAACRVTVED